MHTIVLETSHGACVCLVSLSSIVVAPTALSCLAFFDGSSRYGIISWVNLCCKRTSASAMFLKLPVRCFVLGLHFLCSVILSVRPNLACETLLRVI